MFRTLFIYIFVTLLTPLCVLGHTFSSDLDVAFQQNGSVAVPISPLSHVYAKRSVISFEVCGGGVLLDATRNAAQLWNVQLTGRVQVRITPSDCARTARIRNGRNELYYSEPNQLIDRAVGLYQGILDREFDMIREEDITVKSSISDLTFLTNIITHELGHALGLNHPANSTCRESVMAAYACRQLPTPPTSADIDAAKRIYQLKSAPLHRFDRNRNGFIDNTEFFHALDLWLDQQIGDLTFFDLIDAWIAKRAIPVIRSKRFSLLNAERIELFDLSGDVVGTFSGRNLYGALERLPRETYLYRIKIDGQYRIGMIVKS